MQRFIGVRAGVLVLILVGIVAYLVSAATIYNDPDGRFAFTTPDGYIQRFRAGTDVSFRSLTTQTSTFDVTVIAQAPDPLPSADTIATNTLKGLNPPAYTPGASGIQPTVLSGQSARRFDYYTSLEGVSTRTHTLQIVAVTPKAAYVLVFSAVEDDYDQMINDTAIVLGSFAFSGSGGVGSVTTGSSTATFVTRPSNSRTFTTGSSTAASVVVPIMSATAPVTTRPTPLSLPPIATTFALISSATPTPVIADTNAPTIPVAAGQVASVDSSLTPATQQPHPFFAR